MSRPARTKAIFFHQDTLNTLNEPAPLSQKLAALHVLLKQRYSFIARISVALYDPKTDLLKTFLDSGASAHPLRQYAAKLTDVPSLRETVAHGAPRVVNNLDVFQDEQREHTRRIRASGYGASYTLPMYLNGAFFGFVFFNSRRKHVFTDEVLHDLDLFGHLTSLTVINDVAAIRTLQASVKTAADMVHHRDIDTGSHLDRMANFSRLIARELAPVHQLTDDLIEHIFLFAPLHDIGKIAIPDEILRKPGTLDDAERSIMRSHTAKGREIIDVMLNNFGLDGLEHIDMLRNIALYHHEAMNGSGYPKGLSGEDIPIEARIVAVADIFDALTSRRSYKKAWTNDEAFDTLLKMAGSQIDRKCVDALMAQRQEVEQIQARFKEDPYG
ncbi:MAG: HD domain-containing protein [Nitrospira sp.]|nr:HD domain-containing protein [Nitrospira sp.]